MTKPNLIDFAPPGNGDQDEFSSFYLMALILQEIPIKKEEFDFIREQCREQTTLDEMTALALASSITDAAAEGISGLSRKGFRGLCNTVRYFYDFNHIRFDGEYYWFSPDKKIIHRIRKMVEKKK